MARKVLTNLDLQWNQLEKLRLENVPSTIVDGNTAGKLASNYLMSVGTIAYFSYDNTLKYKDNDDVKTIATTAYVGNAVKDINKFLTDLGKTGGEVSASLQNADEAYDWVLGNGDKAKDAGEYIDALKNLGNLTADELDDAIGLGVEANGWGNHAEAGYDKFTTCAVADKTMHITTTAVTGTPTGAVFIPSEQRFGAVFGIFPKNVWGSYNFAQLKNLSVKDGKKVSDYLVEGTLISADGNIYRYNGDGNSNDVWELVYEGASVGLTGRVETLEAIFDTANDDDDIINKWHEVKEFINGFTETDDLAKILADMQNDISGKLSPASVTANTGDYTFAKWSSNGLVSGTGGTAFNTTMTVNGTPYSNILRTENSNLPAFFAPTTSGTPGQVLVSNGTGQAPTWEKGVTKKVFTSTVQVKQTPSANSCAWYDENYNLLKCDVSSIGNDACVKVYYKNSDKDWEEIIADVNIKDETASGQTTAVYTLYVSFAQSMTGTERTKIKVVVIG